MLLSCSYRPNRGGPVPHGCVLSKSTLAILLLHIKKKKWQGTTKLQQFHLWWAVWYRLQNQTSQINNSGEFKHRWWFFPTVVQQMKSYDLMFVKTSHPSNWPNNTGLCGAHCEHSVCSTFISEKSSSLLCLTGMHWNSFTNIYCHLCYHLSLSCKLERVL